MGDASDWAAEQALDELIERVLTKPFDMRGTEETLAKGIAVLNRATWTTKEGVVMAPVEMTDAHRRNLRALLIRRVEYSFARQRIMADAAKVVRLTAIGAELDRLSPPAEGESSD